VYVLFDLLNQWKEFQEIWYKVMPLEATPAFFFFSFIVGTNNNTGSARNFGVDSHYITYQLVLWSVLLQLPLSSV
jgi:hypothetical protein